MRKNICVIDDDYTSNYITSKMLGKYGPSSAITCFESAPSAIDFLKGLRSKYKKLPDYIFLDLSMPSMDGWEFLDSLDKLNLDPTFKSRVYILSLSLKPSDWKKSAVHPRVSGFYFKPLNFENIENVFE